MIENRTWGSTETDAHDACKHANRNQLNDIPYTLHLFAFNLGEPWIKGVFQSKSEIIIKEYGCHFDIEFCVRPPFLAIVETQNEKQWIKCKLCRLLFFVSFLVDKSEKSVAGCAVAASTSIFALQKKNKKNLCVLFRGKRQTHIISRFPFAIFGNFHAIYIVFTAIKI